MPKHAKHVDRSLKENGPCSSFQSSNIDINQTVVLESLSVMCAFCQCCIHVHATHNIISTLATHYHNAIAIRAMIIHDHYPQMLSRLSGGQSTRSPCTRKVTQSSLTSKSVRDPRPLLRWWCDCLVRVDDALC